MSAQSKLKSFVFAVLGAVAMLGSLFGTFKVFGEEAKSAGVAAAAEVQRDAHSLRTALERHLEDESDSRAEARQEMKEIRSDVRALYRAMRGGARQPRLERAVE